MQLAEAMDEVSAGLRERVRAYSPTERFARLQALQKLTIRTMSPLERAEYMILVEPAPIVSATPPNQQVIEEVRERENDTRRPAP